MSMPKRTPDQIAYRAQTLERIDQQLRSYYRACTADEMPPRLLAVLTKLGEETEPSAEQLEMVRHT